MTYNPRKFKKEDKDCKCDLPDINAFNPSTYHTAPNKFSLSKHQNYKGLSYKEMYMLGLGLFAIYYFTKK